MSILLSLVYDVARKETFDSLGMWLQEVEQFSMGGGKEVVKLLVGNKIDQGRVVSREVSVISLVWPVVYTGASQLPADSPAVVRSLPLFWCADCGRLGEVPGHAVHGGQRQDQGGHCPGLQRGRAEGECLQWRSSLASSY